MSRTGKASTAPHGFTLIEVVVVLSVLALVTALVLPMMSGTQSKADVQSSAPHGFTLIEVVVVLGVLALVTALVLPMMSGTQSKADVQSSARDLAAALRLTRNLAMTHGHTEALVIDTTSGAFRAGSSSAPRRVASGVSVVLVTATQEEIDEHTGSIRFFADGSSTGGGIRLSKGNNRDQVLVDWLTGRVSVGDGVNAAR